uniref:Uncharacterized protein n=1 Tax=Sphaerodactylus townsendi TaxID=933632 RepID=A0ACB8FNX3_9SAUR
MEQFKLWHYEKVQVSLLPYSQLNWPTGSQQNLRTHALVDLSILLQMNRSNIVTQYESQTQHAQRCSQVS